MNSIQKTARMTGIFILSTAVIGPLGMLYVPSTLIVPGDATTANQILASEGLFRLGMVGDMVVFLIEIALCALLKPVSKALALVAAFARLLYCFAWAILQRLCQVRGLNVGCVGQISNGAR